MARILLRPHRDPASRIEWIEFVDLISLPGMFVYLLLGEVSIGRRRVARLRAMIERMLPMPGHTGVEAANTEHVLPEQSRSDVRQSQEYNYQPRRH